LTILHESALDNTSIPLVGLIDLHLIFSKTVGNDELPVFVFGVGRFLGKVSFRNYYYLVSYDSLK